MNTIDGVSNMSGELSNFQIKEGKVKIDTPNNERTISGSYQGKNTDGTFERNVKREEGSRKKQTTWANENGEVSRKVEITKDKETGDVHYSASTTGPDGNQIYSRNVGISTDGEGIYSINGQLQRPNGIMADVEKTITVNDDGSRAVNAEYTGPEDNTITVNKEIQKTEDSRISTGEYYTNKGKSVSFEYILPKILG